MGKLLIFSLMLVMMIGIVSSLPIHSTSESEGDGEPGLANLARGTNGAATSELYQPESNQNEASIDNGGHDDKWQKYQEEDEQDYDDDDDDDDDDSDDEGICLFCRRNYLKEPPVDLVCRHRFHLSCLNLYKRKHDNPLKCPLCKKQLDIKVTGNEPSLEELFYREELNELIKNKLKIGLQAARELMPSDWEHLPKKFEGRRLY